MIKVVELLLDSEFMDVDRLKSSYLIGVKDYLSGYGYNVTPVDGSDWYSYERKIVLDTNAPTSLIDTALSIENKKQKEAMGVLVS